MQGVNPKKEPPRIPEDQIKEAIATKLDMRKTAPVERTRGRGGNGNFPNAQNEQVTEEDCRVALSEVLRWAKMPKVQTDDELADRIEFYFNSTAERGIRPVWEEVCLAIGYEMQTVKAWQRGENCTPKRSAIIKAANLVMASYDARLTIHGKMNPVPYIFRAKNYYGMTDEQQVVVTPNNPLGENTSAAEIAEKYAALPEE